MMSVVLELAPNLFPFVQPSYSTPFSLFGGSEILQSSEGVHQGDTLGLLLFCISLSLSAPLSNEIRSVYPLHR